MRSPHDAHFTAIHVAQEARRAQPYGPETKYEEAERSMSERVASEVAGPLDSGSHTRSITHPIPGKGRGPSSPLTNKYHNVKTDGYASKREAKRAKTLYALQAAKVISNLRKQVPYVLIPKQLDHDGSVGERACTYVADFVYTDSGSGQEIVEDCKGVRTADYIIKRKLMRFMHGIVVRET